MTKKLKKLRIDFQLTQGDVSKVLGLKNTSSYSKKENGKTDFSQSEIKKLIKLFRLDPEETIDIFFS